MPSLHTQVYAGTKGKKDAQTLRTLPPAAWRRDVQNRPDTQDLHHRNVVGPNPLLSVIKSNQGVRGALPLKGVQGASRNQPDALRAEPVPYQGALYPHTGIARKEAYGLAYLEEKPLNRTPMRVADFFSPGGNSSIGAPN
jgi:hypothetical protein